MANKSSYIVNRIPRTTYKRFHPIYTTKRIFCIRMYLPPKHKPSDEIIGYDELRPTRLSIRTIDRGDFYVKIYKPEPDFLFLMFSRRFIKTAVYRIIESILSRFKSNDLSVQGPAYEFICCT